MSKRSEIIDGYKASTANRGLIYTEVLGWIDLGHARGDDVKKLMGKLREGEASGKKYYDVKYIQSMLARGVLRTGKYIEWRIKRGRTYYEQQSITLAMMMTCARKFEAFQSAFPNNLVTDSGFSGEDLVSDLLGFYRVMSIHNPFHILRPLNKDEALRRWDHYGPIGSFKNESFTPLLFPDPARFPHAKPYWSELPPFMKTIMPYGDFSSGNVSVSTNDGTYIKIGKVESRL
ncbi:hypothetical protein HF675_03440 [Serratia sp. JUb9]|uniref:hypothetical protein n=1 Tax=unclassified Serratia (in: enterobacteria) TaxID=2647522 RepID=UPI000CF70E2A|nr:MULTISPECIES: hypothetical protein [unclassified Serratia (in: enterobacteria)]AVJ19257.1 hypothetical protein CLM71_20030 [Serratia sp. MYb239]MCA4825078.1 hypothetical protein [Serratia rubidaea]QNK33133.1 hypothetical protein HF675_03440 [Serratia sp. JUb9]